MPYRAGGLPNMDCEILKMKRRKSFNALSGGRSSQCGGVSTKLAVRACFNALSGGRSSQFNLDGTIESRPLVSMPYRAGGLPNIL